MKSNELKASISDKQQFVINLMNSGLAVKFCETTKRDIVYTLDDDVLHEIDPDKIYPILDTLRTARTLKEIEKVKVDYELLLLNECVRITEQLFFTEEQ